MVTSRPAADDFTRRRGRMPAVPRGRRGRAGVLIIVQNLPVPFDRRVWLECQALIRAGYRVSVICPRGPGDPAQEALDGVMLYKYPLPPTGSGKSAYVREYARSFWATTRLMVRAWRADRFDVLQACNPPDIFWPLGLAMRAAGVSFVFDHHDLCPELYASKYGGVRSIAGFGLRLLEWCTFRTAEHVVATNESYRAVALVRGAKRPEEVTVVRTGPDPARMARGPACAELRRGRRYLVAYLGVMGPQDGVDLAVEVAARVVHGLGRSDVSFTFVGAGDAYDDVVALRDQLGLRAYVELPGRLSDDDVARLLSTADVGLCPDPKNPLNDVSTMNKTMEYMAYGLPVVAFDLLETRVSAADAAVYAKPNDVTEFAGLLLGLLADEPRRHAMGAAGRKRVVETLAWSRQAPAYVRVFDRLIAERRGPTALADVATR